MIATEQLVEIAHERLAQLAPFIGVDAHASLSTMLTGKAATIVRELNQTNDARLAAEACQTVMSICWPTGNPDRDDPDWWRTPLGILCARSLGHTDAESVTHAVAAAMLGVHPGTVAQLVHRGTLDRHPDGRVLRASVLHRLARHVTP